MPEFRFYATRDEGLQLLRALLSRGDLKVVPGKQDPVTPEPRTYTGLTAELEEALHQDPGMQLHGPYSTHPPRKIKVKEGPDAGHYFVCDGSGGHHVLLRLPSLSPEGILRQGSLWTQPHYWLTETEASGPTPALKAAYGDMVKQLKQHLVRWQGLCLSPGALQLLKDGQAELPGDLKPLGVLLRKAKDLPALGPAVPSTSRKTTKRHAAAKSARAE